MDSPSRYNSDLNDWPLTLTAAEDALDNERFVYLIYFITTPIGGLYLIPRAGGAFGVALTAGVGALLLGIVVWIMGYALRIWWRRSRGMADLVLDENSLHGAFVPVRGGRLAWGDILEVGTFLPPRPHYGEPVVLLHLREGVVRSWDARMHGAQGARFRREIGLSPDTFGLSARELERLLRRGAGSARGAGAGRDMVIPAESSLTKRAARLQSYIAAVRKGETVEFRATPLRRVVFGLLFLPLLAVLTAAFVGGPFIWYWLVGPEDSEFFLPMVVLCFLALCVGPLVAYVFYQQCRRAPAVTLGRPVLRLGPAGITDPSGVFLRATVPWSAVYSASVYIAPRSGDFLYVHGDRLDRYAKGVSVVNRLLKGGLAGGPGKFSVQHQDTPLSSLELRDLIETCIKRWGRG